MDAYIRKLLKKEQSEFWLVVVLTLLAIAVRVLVRSFVAEDWSVYWSNWLLQFQEGGFRALKDDFYDYAPPVMYLLYLITRLPLNPMTAFKGICCLLEILGAFVIAKIVLLCTKSQKKAVFSYGIFLFWPTVILNAAVWSQCDIIYTLLILCSVYFLLKDKTWTGMWFYGAAFAVKLQTLFIFPFLVILWVHRKIKIKHFVTIPVMYLLGILPAWIAGRPFLELLGIYAFQGGKDRWSLSIKFPNIYQIIGNNYFLDEYVGAGMYLILGILMIVLFWMAYQNVHVTKEYTILMVIFFGMLTTYFLPHMHERYLYLTDAFLLIYVMIRVKRFPLLMGASFLTVVGYAQYLTKKEPYLPYGVLAFVQLGILLLIGLDLYWYSAGKEEGKSSEKGLDKWLLALLFQEFSIGKLRFSFLEGLLAVCITGIGCMLRTPFETGMPHWAYLLAEWYLAVAVSVLVFWYTINQKKALITYAMLMILPVIVAEGTILRGDAVVGCVLFVSALLFLGTDEERAYHWLFTVVTAALLLWSVRYIGILFACMVLWQRRKLRSEQLLVLLAAGGARFLYAYKAWIEANYTLTTFHWANIYEIVGKEAVLGQLIDPIALVGLFLTLGIVVLLLYLFSIREWEMGRIVFVRLLLFFGLIAGYFLPYMDQSYGYLYCVLSVVYIMLCTREFLVAMLLQIVTFAGYQEAFHGASMMSMTIFAVIQFLIIGWLGIQLLIDTGVLSIWRQRN